jgi:hypothetical protein
MITALKWCLGAVAVAACLFLLGLWWLSRGLDNDRLSYHAEIMDTSLDLPFDRPVIPVTAKNVHIESSFTLNEGSLQVRFSDSAQSIEEFLKSADLILQPSLSERLPDAFCSLDEAPFDASSVKKGRSYYRYDNTRQGCVAVVVDEDSQTVFYESTSW